MPYPYVNETANCLSKVELFPRRNVAARVVVRYAVVEGRGKSPKECIRTHTESCDDKHFPKVGLEYLPEGIQ